MTLIVTRAAASHYRAAAPPKEGTSPLRIEQNNATWELWAFDFRENATQRRTLIGVYPSEKEAEQAAGAFADRGKKAPPHGVGGGSAAAKRKLSKSVYGRK